MISKLIKLSITILSKHLLIIINDINCDFVEKIVNHELITHPAKGALISVKENMS